jgi:hypothetical protein
MRLVFDDPPEATVIQRIEYGTQIIKPGTTSSNIRFYPG